MILILIPESFRNFFDAAIGMKQKICRLGEFEPVDIDLGQNACFFPEDSAHLIHT